jgi:hypothetical protein
MIADAFIGQELPCTFPMLSKTIYNTALLLRSINWRLLAGLFIEGVHSHSYIGPSMS